MRPDALDADAALALMLADPLLIRRPLIEAEGRREAGFDAALIDAWIGLSPGAAGIGEWLRGSKRRRRVRRRAGSATLTSAVND